MTPARLFRGRLDAGRLLADRLRPYADRDDALVLGLPRGGVPVAEALGAPMDALIVRKVGVPGHEEVAVGAITAVADEVVAVAVPVHFAAVGLWYEDFAATTDDEVRRWLARFGSDRGGERGSA